MDAELRARLDRAVADALGLTEQEPAGPARAERRKLVAFVPRESLDTVREALFAAGAGRIGGYERCSWYAAGTGTFLGGEGTDPNVGEAGREERVAELRLETVYPRDGEAEVIRALLGAHPYEEPVFDLYELASIAPGQTAGVLGSLEGDPEERLRAAGVEPVFRRRAARGARVAVFTGAPGPCRADVVVAPAGEPDLLAPTLEAWALERVASA